MTTQENYLRIDGPDQNGIYGYHVTAGNDAVVIHLHGLTHGANSLLGPTSAEYFIGQGYDHYRIGFYDLVKDSRSLDRSNLTTHLRDLENVLAYFQPKYKKIFVTAHSLSGLLMVMHNPENIAAVSLWDPALDVRSFWTKLNPLTPLPGEQILHLDYGAVFVLSQEMVNEIYENSGEKVLGLARRVTTPTQIVVPEEAIFAASPPEFGVDAFQKSFRGPVEVTNIPGANHTFSKWGNRDALFKATSEWFERFR